jgi:hypothetical protein
MTSGIAFKSPNEKTVEICNNRLTREQKKKKTPPNLPLEQAAGYGHVIFKKKHSVNERVGKEKRLDRITPG